MEESGVFKISIDNFGKGNFINSDKFKYNDITFIIIFPFSNIDNLFTMKIRAEPTEKLPITASVKLEIPGYLTKDYQNKKTKEFSKEANSDALYFPLKIKDVVKSMRNKKEQDIKVIVEIKIQKTENSMLYDKKANSFNNDIDTSWKNIENNQNTSLQKQYKENNQNTSFQKQYKENNQNTSFQKQNKENNQNTSSQKQKREDNQNINNISSSTQNAKTNNTKAPETNKSFIKNVSQHLPSSDDSDDYSPKPKISIDNDIDPKYNGLYNQGATCYINSAIQSLFHIPIFRKIIYDIPTDIDKDQENSVPLNLQCLFYNLQCNKTTCSTKMLTTSLGFNKFDVFHQEDTEEFLKKLIANLEDALKKIPNMKDKISSVFEGKTIQLIKDVSKHEISKSEDIFFDLSVDVHSTLEESLKYFTKPEHISDYVSSSSPNPQPVTIQTFFLNLPQVLFIYIKRYKFNLKTGLSEKDNSEMAYAEDIDLGPFMYEKSPKQCTKYKLYGVIVHSGMVSGGHYYMFCKPEFKNEWYEFNDTYVQAVRAKEAIDKNFGGYEKYSYSSVYSWKKDYSAYMLIYVRADSIKEVFKPIDINQIPQSVISFSEKAKNIELKRRKSDPECQISFNVYNEKCIWENCKVGITSYINLKYCIKVVADKRSTAEDLYQNVANMMKINVDCLRLWVISNKGTTFHKVLQKDDKLSLLRVQNLFAQFKDEKEKLVESNTKTYFLILYTPDCVKPFFFMKMRKYKSNEKTYSKYTVTDKDLEYREIIDDGVSILNQNNTSKIASHDVSIYIIRDQKLTEKKYYLSCYEEDGAIMILQVNNPKSGIDSEFLKKLKKDLKITRYFDNIKNDDYSEPSDVFKYLDYMENKLPKKVEEYFELRNNIRKASVYSFSNISQKRGVIEFPCSAKISDLTRFIELAFELKLNENKETLLLFEREENNNIPKSKPFNIRGGSKLSECNLDSIFYYISSNNNANNYLSETRVVQYSKDAFSIAKVVCFYMPDSEIHPFQQFTVLNNNFFNDSDQTRMFIVDQENKAGSIIKSESQENLYNINNKDKLRIEIIPDDQNGKDLLLVYKGFVDGYRIQLFEDPFYFAFIQDEPVASFTKRVSQFLKIKESFKVCKKKSMYMDSYLFKDKIRFESWDKERTVFLLFEMD